MLHLLGKMMLFVLLGLSAASSHCAQDGSCTAPEHDGAAMLQLSSQEELETEDSEGEVSDSLGQRRRKSSAWCYRLSYNELVNRCKYKNECCALLKQKAKYGPGPSPPTTVTTTVTGPGAFLSIVSSTLSMQVTDPAAFVADPLSQQSVQQAVAIEAGVPVDTVNVTLSVATPLLLLSLGQPGQQGTVTGDYTITEQFATAAEAQAEANRVVNNLNAVSENQWTSEINTQLQNNGVSDTVLVTQADTPTSIVTPGTTTTAGPTTAAPTTTR